MLNQTPVEQVQMQEISASRAELRKRALREIRERTAFMYLYEGTEKKGQHPKLLIAVMLKEGTVRMATCTMRSGLSKRIARGICTSALLHAGPTELSQDIRGFVAAQVESYGRFHGLSSLDLNDKRLELFVQYVKRNRTIADDRPTGYYHS